MGRWISTVCFNMSVGISPIWGGFRAIYINNKLSHFIFCYMTKRELLSSIDSFFDFFDILVNLTLRTSSRLLSLPLLTFFSSKSVTILIKKLFIMVASSFSSETRLPFSFNKSLFEFKPLLLK